LTTPLSEDQVRELRIGDVVYLTGSRVYIITTSAAQYLFDSIEKKKPFFDLNGSVIYHSSLSLTHEDKIRWVGATTSIMCEPETPRLIELGSKAIMGKGGMGRATLDSMRRNGAVYLATVGGTSALLARGVSKLLKIVDTPVPMSEIEVKDFGPTIVGMDSHGRSIYDDVWENARRKAAELAGANGKARLYGRFY